MLIAFRQRLLQTLDEIELVDLTLVSEHLQGFNKFRSGHDHPFLRVEIDLALKMRALHGIKGDSELFVVD